MGSQTPKAAGSNAPPFRPADHNYRQLPATSSDVESTQVGIDAAGSMWHSGPKIQEGPSHEERQCLDMEGVSQRMNSFQQNAGRSRRASSSTYTSDIPEQLAELIMDMIPGAEGEELGDAFRCSTDLPPITKQSLSELDIQNIITNIKLRHDVNFDRDLSFRPNLDGAKGQEKLKASEKYWKALIAELKLYVRLFQGSPPLWNTARVNGPEIVQHAQKRIPKMFETIQEVLKSLVPDRDHARVDEHLDVPMLMQEIERGVCDLVRLAEWMSHLLKEHCAPMRDERVDKMVESTRDGVANNDSKNIVRGLRELFGILEAMKLDVANHQIRNLKTLLIEDTVNFERHYHLDRLVNGRARVNIDSAQKWYSLALEDFRQQCTPQRDIHRFQLDVFVRAVVSMLFSANQRCDFPETFYLDQDRLRVLKAEAEDLILLEICFDMFGLLLKDLGYMGPISHSARYQLRASLSAIIGEGVGQGFQQWVMNSEPISLELVRQALAIAGLPPSYNLDDLQKANQHLRTLFYASFPTHASSLEASILPQILAMVNQHMLSSPIDLFNNLITLPSPPPPPHTPSYTSLSMNHIPNDTLAPQPEQFTDLSSRITHIILLHWRIWGPIAYVQDDEPPIPNSEEKPTTTISTPTPQTQSPPPINTEAPAILKTGEPPDSGQETQFAHETSLP
ncbi:Tcp11-domain-containing protein [Melanomma pulvis-pyrius CBS 109.77]|uniref:Tcp11-domain-containing protein n=1 Tax=Melanomma pulvis-pyrius CBS 109.77 TaxID=1314802 RepID=A0A6A6XF35_9PLEO|nr:Tcp11-domain-containing protein [Melanomma pulvis-pyrius CBS 109.77]